MSRFTPLSADQALQIYAVLVDLVGAHPDDADSFAHYLTRPDSLGSSEWRCQGKLGFGGKFHRASGARPDGSFGETWRVSCYPEDRTTERDQIIDRTNATLQEMLAVHLAADNTQTDGTTS